MLLEFISDNKTDYQKLARGRADGHLQKHPQAQHSNCNSSCQNNFSNNSYFIQEAEKSNKKLKVSAFEPNPDLFSALEKNLKLNRIRNVKSEQMALDNQPGEAYLYLNHDIHTSIGSLIQTSTAGKKILVRKTTLDIYCENYSINQIDLMKIDVEGYETNILQGGMSIIMKSNPIILMESLSQKTLETQYDLLSKLGYLKPLQVNGDGFDLNNWLWFTESHRDKVSKVSHLLINYFQTSLFKLWWCV